MIYVTLLLYVKEGKEAAFFEFEELALPILKDYNGKLLLRLRPTDDSIISVDGERPYEIHFLSFNSEEDFNDFGKDKRRNEFLHLKEQSIKATLLVKGKEL